MPGAPTYFTFRYTRIFEASAKGKKEDLTQEEESALKQIVKGLKREDR